MQPEEIKALLQEQIADSQVEVNVEGSHVNVVVVSPAFEGLTPVKKQQLVYGVLSDQIASGAIHAVNMKTYTPEQWAKQG
ncbi:BolA/IbaG family iron-sulfur metabolism protein [Pseudomaricurvus alkylphenolicus]|jgi:acid stress-induced BolA-like protein IbaG/YrbA|uniref:BolA family protein n=1 Tax=Pseudomaricurvus alkylphenolicus TaxID=1306991 RepID=UPI0014222CDA|nr:BolA/IbaG family iron-sulfur metabolism protein [Pseudomaricurvus alkylphenolicus]NIB41866.1 BolA/IbaG family iron-sulfur metabolism protein [Pseudomaricurvus alkylphenolicus]